MRTLFLYIFFSCLLDAEVDQERARQYFQEVAALCEREAGRIWGVSLCGPLAFVDPTTHTIATNQPAPAGPWPPLLGYANTAIEWGGTRWSTVVWQGIPADPKVRGRLMLHELFHRVQPQLGFTIQDGQNDHLDTIDGRYWLQLEWRALAAALSSAGKAQEAAVGDALAFRSARRQRFPESKEAERRLEMNEGLAQYTATAAAFDSSSESRADAIDQLRKAPGNATFVRTFPYPSGAAYGLLLDRWWPGWPRRIKASDDLPDLLQSASGQKPSPDLEAAALRYGSAGLRSTEEKRDSEQKARLAELRRRFVEGPVLRIPNTKSSSFTTNGMTPIPGEGTIYPTFRTQGEWGSLEAEQVLMTADRNTLIVPAPPGVTGNVLQGERWTLKLAAGWTVRRSAREGDFEITRDSRSQ